MARPCSICGSSDRNAIDEAILDNEPERSIAVRFGVTRSSVHRHKAHPPAAIVKADTLKEIKEAVSIKDKIASLEQETREILQEARAAIGKDNRLALLALQRLEKQYELRAKIEGELENGKVQVATQVNVAQAVRIESPEDLVRRLHAVVWEQVEHDLK